MELTNLATQLSNEDLQNIGRQVYEDYTADENSRAEHLEKHARYLELYYQTDKPGEALGAWAADESVPLMTEACNQFQARAYKAFFPNRNFITAAPMEIRSEKTWSSAERIGKHLSYQLTVKNKYYRPDKNAMFLAAALHGSDFTKTYYDPVRRQNVIERVRSTDLVIPYGIGPRRIEDVERKTQIIPMSVNEATKLAQSGWFTDGIDPNYTRDRDNRVIQDVVDEAHGTAEDSRERDFGCVLEQHRLLDLDGDGIAEPYIVWYDIGSQKVLRIQVRYEVDANGEAVPDEYGLLKQPIEYYTHYQFLPNPDGFYGNGYGHVIGQLNMAINKVLRQQLDAGTLANIGNMSGFISERLGIHGDDVELQPGLFKKLPRSVEDIAKAIYQFKFPGPNNSQKALLDELITFAQRASSTTDAVTGDIEKVMQPLTIMTLLENALQMPTSIMEQMALPFEDELMKLYRLNRKHMARQEIFLDGDEQILVTPQDYAEDLRILPALDPRNITRQQRIAKSQEVYGLVMNNPMLAQNPQSVQDATRRVLEAMDVEDIDRLLPPPPEVENIDDQDVENMFFMLPKDKRPNFDVLPEQDHAAHILSLHQFIHWLTSMDPIEDVPAEVSLQPNVDQTIRQVAGQLKEGIITDVILHLTQHVAYFYAEQRGVLNGQGSNGEMAAQRDDAARVEQALAGLQSLGIPVNLPAGQGGALSGAGGGVAPDTGMDDPGILGLGDIMPEVR